MRNCSTKRKVGFNSGERETPIKKPMETEHNGVRVWHSGYSTGSLVQDIVTYAYKLGGFDFVAVLECENGQFKLDAVGDSGHAFGLCQVNDRWHKDIPADYTTNWVVAVEYCYQKFKD